MLIINKMLRIIFCFVPALFILAACGDNSRTTTVTKDVTVTFPTFAAAQSISFAPVYTPDGGDWGEHFSASDIVCTVVCNELSKFYDSSNGFTVLVTGEYVPDTYTFIQTFKVNGKTIGSQTIKVKVYGGNFTELYDEDDNLLSPQIIPPVVLHLTSPIT